MEELGAPFAAKRGGECGTVEKEFELRWLARAMDVECLQIPVTAPIPYTLLSLLRIFCMMDN